MAKKSPPPAFLKAKAEEAKKAGKAEEKDEKKDEKGSGKGKKAFPNAAPPFTKGGKAMKEDKPAAKAKKGGKGK